MEKIGYYFIPCVWHKHLKKFTFGPGLDTPLKDFPDIIQPGDGFMNYFVDSEGHMEKVRLIYGDRETGMHFDPEPIYLSKDMGDIIGYFRELSDEMNDIIKYGIEFNKQQEEQWRKKATESFKKLSESLNNKI